MKKNKIKNIVGLIVLFIILSSCKAYKTVDIGDVNNVNFKGMADNKISLELSVPVTNPNAYKIKIKSMDLDVTINGKYLGKMKNADEIIIPAKSNDVQIFPVDIHVTNILASMSSLYKIRKSKSFEMQIEGTIKVKAFISSKTIEVSEKQSVTI